MRSLSARRRPDAISAKPVATPLLVGGMTNGAIALTRDLMSPLGIEPLQAGGGGAQDPSAPPATKRRRHRCRAGFRGRHERHGPWHRDARRRRQAVAFGHPMMEAGVTSLPTCIAGAVVLASDQRSFKIGMGVRDVGALIQDRQASITISHTAVAPVVPLKVSVKGVPGLPAPTELRDCARKIHDAVVRVRRDRSAVQAVANERQTCRGPPSASCASRATVRFVSKTTASPSAARPKRASCALQFGARHRRRHDNPWQPPSSRAPTSRSSCTTRATSCGCAAPSCSIRNRRRQTAHVRVTLVPYSGPEQTRVLSVDLPAYLGRSTVSLEIRRLHGRA